MMKRTVLFILLFVAAVFLVNVPNVLAQSADKAGINKQDQSQKELTADQQREKSDREMTQKNRAADNTGINTRDRSEKELTAGQQGQSKSDRDMTQDIRRAVVANKSLSTNATNVKIITMDGKVTLKGPVSSAEEKNAIEEIAAGIAGKGNVKNEIGITQKRADN